MIESWALGALERIANAESRFYIRNHRYGELAEIEAEYGLLIAPFQHPGGPYSIRMTADASHYRVTAVPGSHLDEGCCCFFGLVRYRSFFVDESHVVRYDAHCRPASERSPQWRGVY
jgi:hypothetical protein